MWRKPNADRVRRHQARSTPDKIQRYFDPMEDDVMDKYQRWLTDFAKKMDIKHGNRGCIDIFQEDTLLYGREKLITCEWRSYESVRT